MNSRVVLSVSPHPDDELIGAGATLMALRDEGWRVVNLACGLGRLDDRERRLVELVRACELAGFSLLVPDPLPSSEEEVVAEIVAALDRVGAALIVGPSPEDRHPWHEVVGRAIRGAVERRGRPMHVAFWGLWGELPDPNVLVPFDRQRRDELLAALRAHAGELARNRFDQLVCARAAANAVLGAERVFGFGEQGGDYEYAELLSEVEFDPRSGWGRPSSSPLASVALRAVSDLVQPAAVQHADDYTTALAGQLAAAAAWTQANTSAPQMMSGLVDSRLLEALIVVGGARRVLEVGTFTGVGTLTMAAAIGPEGRVTTLELDPETAATAQRHFDESPVGDRIELIVGHALETMAGLSGPFDLVYIDAWKADYPAYYDAALPLLAQRGVIVADNMFRNGTVFDPAVEDEGVTGIREFSRRVQEDDRVHNLLLTVGDGVMLAWRRPG